MNYALQSYYSEEKFIQACIEKDAAALKILYEEHYPIMFSVCKRYARNEAEALDILHDGFIKVFNNISKYQIGTSLIAWIKRVIVNTAIDYYRRESRRRSVDIEDAKGIVQDSPDALSKMSAEEILELLQHLTPAYRSVFNMYVIEGYSHKELADILGITESTSRSNLVKARTKLKELISSRFDMGSFLKGTDREGRND
jgi:RNA polymerase sigma factor (sigma-70 family)